MKDIFNYTVLVLNFKRKREKNIREGTQFKFKGTKCFPTPHPSFGASQVALVIKNPPANAENLRDVGSIPGLGGSPRGGHGNLFQYLCLENPMDRGAWQDTVHGVIKSPIWLKQLNRSFSWAK